MAIAGIAAVASLLPYEHVFPQLPYHAHVDSLLTVVVGMWAVEAALFALTAAVTAILINISAEPQERTKWFIRYRARAFDATATLAIFTLLWTGALAALTMGAQADGWDYTYIIVSAFVLFAFDLIGIGWLLVYSHILLATATSRRIPDLLAELRAAIRQAAIREVSIPIFDAWTQAHGLATDMYDFGYPPRTHPLMARGPGFVHDLNLSRMGRWTRSLSGSIRPGVAAIVRLNFNGFVLEGTQLGAISPDDADREGGFFRATVMRPGRPAMDLEQTFKRLTDQAQAAATAGRLADLDAELEVLQATQREIFELTSKLSGARQTLVTSLAGWQPEIQFRISLHRLGRAVLSSESADVVNRWLKFVQEILVVTRNQRGEDLQQIFHLWTQVATREDIPDGWNYLERLTEYAKALDMGLQRAPTEEMVRVLGREAQAYLISLRHQLVRLAPRYFEDMARIIDSVANGFIRQWSQQRPADQVQQLKENVAAELAQRRQQFWLGYAGWLINRVDRGWIAEDVVLGRWETITPRLPSLSEAYEAWKRLGADDPFQWDHEADRSAGPRRATRAAFCGALAIRTPARPCRWC